VNFYYLSIQAWRGRASLTKSTSPLDSFPDVTVQLPVYNERYVAQRLIEAAAGLDYPREHLEIQVLDDSTDDTTRLVEETVARFRDQGIDIRVLHRTDRHGYKAGALADGLAKSRGQFTAIFDADFVPAPDFLRRVLPYFDNERVGFVQTRWGHLNRDYSVLTFLQSLSIDAHFAVEQLARSRLGYYFNFNGTAGVWRKSAILDAGGWTFETLTEDLDLSYRAFLRGWEARYAGSVEARAELPVSMTAYRRQQSRWARGSLECAIRYVPVIWESDLPFSKKIEAILHLTGYGIHLLLFVLALLYPIILLLSISYSNLGSLFGLVVIFNLTMFAPTVEFAVAQASLRKGWLSFFPAILLMTMFGAGMMVNTLRAALQILFQKRGAFERTPKYGITQRGQEWRTKGYRVRVDGIVLAELLLALFNLFTVILAIRLQNYLIGFYAGLFAFGLFFIAGFTLVQSLTAAFASRERPG